jgi:beta-lactamase regulating signal transducer with metallopeptidase domain
MTKLVGLLALFAAGLLLAGAATAVGAGDVTTTETLSATTTIEETTTAPASTVVTTVEQTTTLAPTSSPTTTTASSSSSSSTPTWVWIVLGILAAAVIGLLVAFFTRGRGGISEEERQRRLDSAVASWATQGWAVESQTPGSTILRRGPELMVVSIDDHGQINTRPVASS